MLIKKNDLYTQKTLVVFILLGLLSILTVSIIILSCVPPVSRDALTHHLAVPKLYLEHGGIYEIPSIVFSYYPMNLDLIYMIPLYFGNDIAPKFIHFIFALLTGWLIFSYLRKRLDKAWGLVGALFFLSLPIIVKLSITVYVDLGLIFFSTASIMSLHKWIESRFQVKYLILSGACCGLALGTKYNGLIVLFILAAFIPLVFISHSKKSLNLNEPQNKENSLKIQFKAIGFAGLYCIIALMVFSPWMIRNYIWRGNPIYPLYNSFFSHAGAQPNNAEIENEEKILSNEEQQSSNKSSGRWGPLAIRKVIYDESAWQIALIPVRIFFEGRDDNPKYFDGKLSPFLFLLPFFAFINLKKNSAALRIEKKMWAAFTILYILYAFLQIDIRIRYLAPIIPPMAILSIFGMHQIASGLARRWHKTPRWFASGCILLLVSGLLIYNSSYIIEQFNNVRPFSFLSGKLNRDEYIVQYRPEYTVIKYINRQLPESSKILTLFLGNRIYYCDRELILDKNLFKNIVKNGESSANVLEGMEKRGITHLLIRYDLFNFWAEKQFSDREKKILRALFETELLKITSQAGYGLFQLSTDGSLNDNLRRKWITR